MDYKEVWELIKANVNNEKITDEQFRIFVKSVIDVYKETSCDQ